MLNRKSAPQFAAIEKFQLPRPEVINLNNGVPLIQFDKVNQEVLRIELIFKSGKWFETKKGVSYFTAHLLDKGTSDKNSLQIAETFDLYGSSVEINPGFDFTSLSLYALSKNINKVFPLFCEIALSPAFPDSEFTLLKDILSRTLRSTKKRAATWLVK